MAEPTVEDVGTSKSSKIKVADTPEYTYDSKTGKHNLPAGWTISDIGAEGYLVCHDGTDPDNPFNPPGMASTFKVHDLADLPVLLEHRGRIPVGHPNNPSVDLQTGRYFYLDDKGQQVFV